MTMHEPPHEPVCLLLIEPNVDVRLALTDFLEAAGYRVKFSGTGNEALLALEEELSYAVALVDIELPDMDGSTLLQSLAHFDPHLPVIVITGLTELDHRLRTYQHGALAFLRKPYNREEVLAIVSRAVKIHNMAQKVQNVEATLHLTEDRYQLVVHATKDAIILADEHGQITEWNEAAERLFGYHADEIIGHSLTGLMPVRYRAAHLRGLEQYRTTGQAQLLGKTLEVHGQKKDGSEISIELSLSLMHQQGQPVFCGVIRDISSRIISEKKLRERERLSGLKYAISQLLINEQPLSGTLQGCAKELVISLEAALARIWVLDIPSQILQLQASAGLYTHLDGAHARIAVGQYKIGRIGLTRKPHLTNHVQEDPEVHDQEWARREGLVAFAGYPLIVKDNLVGVLGMFARHRLTEATLQALANIANGIGLVITQKQAEEHVQQFQEIQNLILHSTQDGIYGLDLQGKTTFVNRAAAHMLGWTPDELLGQFLHELIHHTKPDGTPYPQEACPIYSAFRDGKAHYIPQEIFWRKDGTHFPVEYTSSPQHTRDGRLVGAVVVFRAFHPSPN
jgi:PAS domain S-box-containing protein